MRAVEVHTDYLCTTVGVNEKNPQLGNFGNYSRLEYTEQCTRVLLSIQAEKLTSN